MESGKVAAGYVELVPGAVGEFRIFIDDRVVFYKPEVGRFPTDEDMDRLV